MPSRWPQSSVLQYELTADLAPSSAQESWGWAEFFIAMQLVWGLMLFIPGAQAYRAVIRAMPYLVSGAALVYYFRQGTKERLPPSSSWLVLSFVLLALNLLHGTAHWFAGMAQVVFQVCITAPVFWMARAVRTEAQIRRVLWVFFAASALGAILGVLQVYFPARFLPPEFSSLGLALNPEMIRSLTYVGADGREIVRPPGLSDLPGGAAIAGMMTMMLGVSLGLRTGERWYVKVACLGAAAAGMTALYLTQVRSLTIVAAASVGLFALLRLRQGRVLEGTSILAGGAVLVIGSYVWALSVGGEAVSDRFSGLADEGVLQAFRDNRGAFIRYTLSDLLYEFPLGAGIGRWGMMHVYFGDPTLWQAPPIHAEVQLTGWLLDGGVPLWFLYGGALTAAVLFSYRSATLARTRTLRDAATIILGLQLTIICLCMSGPAFNTQLGILFWGVTGALFGAVQGDHRQHELMDYEVPVA